MGDLSALVRGLDICRKIGVSDPGFPQAVEVAIIDAARTERRIPDTSRKYLSGYRRTIWPHSRGHEVGPNSLLNERVFVTPASVANVEHVLGWNAYVKWGQRLKPGSSEDERRRRAVKILWLAASGISYAAIGRRFGVHRSTVMRIYQQAKADIAASLSEKVSFESVCASHVG